VLHNTHGYYDKRTPSIWPCRMRDSESPSN
jgi:hypothetical protein